MQQPGPCIGADDKKLSYCILSIFRQFEPVICQKGVKVRYEPVNILRFRVPKNDRRMAKGDGRFCYFFRNAGSAGARMLLYLVDKGTYV